MFLSLLDKDISKPYLKMPRGNVFKNDYWLATKRQK